MCFTCLIELLWLVLFLLYVDLIVGLFLTGCVICLCVCCFDGCICLLPRLLVLSCFGLMLTWVWCVLVIVCLLVDLFCVGCFVVSCVYGGCLLWTVLFFDLFFCVYEVLLLGFWFVNCCCFIDYLMMCLLRYEFVI